MLKKSKQNANATPNKNKIREIFSRGMAQRYTQTDPVQSFQNPLPRASQLPSATPRLYEQWVDIDAISRKRTAALEREMSPTVYTTFDALHRLGCWLAREREYSEAVGQVTFFGIGELLADALQLSYSTYFRHMNILEGMGLIAWRGHMTTLNHRHRCDGSVYTVRLDTAITANVKTPVEYLKKQYRDLAQDIAIGNTAYARLRRKKREEEDKMGGSKKETRNKGKKRRAKRLELKPLTESLALYMTMPKRESASVTTILDLLHMPISERSRHVERVATQLNAKMGDQSFEFYCWCIWQALKWQVSGHDPPMQKLHDILLTTLLDLKQSKIEAASDEMSQLDPNRRRKRLETGGAVLVNTLKSSGLFDTLKAAPDVRVSYTRKGDK